MMGRWDALKEAFRFGWKAWCRARPIPVKFVTGVSDPSVSRMDSGEGDPELQIPQDEDSLVLYRDQYGNFATETEIRMGISKLQGPFVYAQACNDEVAMDLVDRMDAIELDAELNPGEKKLRDILKHQLRERDVK